MNKIDKRTLPKNENVIKQISETKQKQSRDLILEKIQASSHKQEDKSLAIPTHRKKKHISFEKYKGLLKKGETVTNILKTTSKHLIYFYNAMIKGKITLSKEDFEKMYNNGMSLGEISKKENISREHITYLREFYGIKRKGATFQKRLKNEKPLSQRAKDVIIGSMLGDGHIAKGGYFTEKHSPKQLDYLKWKASFLNTITTGKSWSYYESTDKRSGSLIKTHSFRTITHSWIIEMEDLFYKKENGKRIKIVPEEITEWINEEILAIWFMDDGKTDWHYRKGIRKGNPISTLCTDSFSIENVERLQRILLEKFNLKSTRNKIRNRINFTTESTLKLHKMIGRFTHKDLQYKTSEKAFLQKLAS